MDDSQQKQQQDTDVVTTQNVPLQPQDITQIPQNQPPMTPPASPSEEQLPAAPVSGPSKEGGPAIPTSEKLIAPSMQEVELPKELQEIGVEAHKELPELTPEDAQAGIVHAKESTPVTFSDMPSIALPMSQQQAQTTVKMHKKVKDSLFWFAMLIMRQWQVAERKKKEVS